MNWPRLGLAIAVGYVAVAAIGLAAKRVIEANSSVVYELHWFTTMPALALLFAYAYLRRPSPAEESG